MIILSDSVIFNRSCVLFRRFNSIEYMAVEKLSDMLMNKTFLQKF